MAEDTQVKSEARVKFEDRVAEVRANFLGIEQAVIALKKDEFLSGDQADGENFGEAIANIMLAYRSTEDARMRLGKVFQALDGGKSPLPR